MSDKPTLCIGDVQGNMQLLEGLLLQEGIIGPCGMCGASGDVSESDEGPAEFCPNCRGSGSARINHDVEVIQLGDLIDARHNTQSADSLCVEFGDLWLDRVLWGNHDRPVVDRSIQFGGYWPPLPEVLHKIKLMHHQDRFRLAHYAHGFLLVHAGLSDGADYKAMSIGPDDPDFATYLNTMDRSMVGHDDWEPTPGARAFVALRDSIGWGRGGRDPFGGILWRDADEPLREDVRQVFAHSSDHNVRRFGAEGKESYCLDLSKHGGLGAVWLPDERIVEFRG